MRFTNSTIFINISCRLFSNIIRTYSIKFSTCANLSLSLIHIYKRLQDESYREAYEWVKDNSYYILDENAQKAITDAFKTLKQAQQTSTRLREMPALPIESAGILLVGIVPNPYMTEKGRCLLYTSGERPKPPLVAVLKNALPEASTPIAPFAASI